MSKKKNYYQVHKNKKPKKLKRKKPNLLVLKSNIISMQSSIQHAIIVSQNFPQSFNSVNEKTKLISDNVINCAKALGNLHAEYIKQKYLNKKASK